MVLRKVRICSRTSDIMFVSPHYWADGSVPPATVHSADGLSSSPGYPPPRRGPSLERSSVDPTGHLARLLRKGLLAGSRPSATCMIESITPQPGTLRTRTAGSQRHRQEEHSRSQ